MPINLDEHAVFIDRLQMDMVPYTVAVKAIEEIAQAIGTELMEAQLNKAINALEDAFSNLNDTVGSLDTTAPELPDLNNDQDSTREP